jgi:anaerobic selenocysteine-containing dehydrogenase
MERIDMTKIKYAATACIILLCAMCGGAEAGKVMLKASATTSTTPATTTTCGGSCAVESNEIGSRDEMSGGTTNLGIGWVHC